MTTDGDQKLVQLTGHRRGLDVAATTALLGVHGALAFCTALWVGLSVMILDPCGYVACGDERWAAVGVRVAYVGALVLVLADLVLSLWRLVAAKRSWFIPVIFILAQLATAAVGFALVRAAGPV